MPQITVRLTDQQLELVGASHRCRRGARRCPRSSGSPWRETASGVVRRQHPRAERKSLARGGSMLDAPDERDRPAGDSCSSPAPARRSRCAPASSCASSRSRATSASTSTCFNLHDYREFIHVGRTRTLHGINPSTGDVPLVRAAARARDDVHRRPTRPASTTRCSRAAAPTMYESVHGFAEHTNCADIQAEAQREYGLTPDDVHDSFNLFMATRVGRRDARDPPPVDAARATMSSCSRWSTCSRSPTSAATTSWAPATSRSNPVRVEVAAHHGRDRRRAAAAVLRHAAHAGGLPAAGDPHGAAALAGPRLRRRRSHGPRCAMVEVEVALDDVDAGRVAAGSHDDATATPDEGDAPARRRCSAGGWRRMADDRLRRPRRRTSGTS